MRFSVRMQVILVDSVRENGDSWTMFYGPVESSKLFNISHLSGN